MHFLFAKTAAQQDFDGLLRGGARHHESGVNAFAGGKGVNGFAVGAAGPKKSKNVLWYFVSKEKS